MLFPESGLRKKMLIYDVRSRNVHENNRNMDKLTAKKRDIYAGGTWILQRNSGHDGPFTWNHAFTLGFVRIFGRPVGTRTPDLYRVNAAILGFTTTYKTAGTAKVRGSRIRHRFLWVGLWVGIFAIRSVHPADHRNVTEPLGRFSIVLGPNG